MNHSESKRKFLHDYGCDGYKIIAAYEEACNIKQNDRFADWFVDMGVFEASLNENVTYKSLCNRYNQGLKYLGIINEQTGIICSEFSSTQLADHIKEEMEKVRNDENYNINSILSKRDIFELTGDILSVDDDIYVDDSADNEIVVALECWFDVEDKFALRLPKDEDVWLNLYGKYNLFEDTVKIECVIDKPKENIYFDYIPSENEKSTIKNLITEAIRKVFDQTPEEFCNEFHRMNNILDEPSQSDSEQTIGGM